MSLILYYLLGSVILIYLYGYRILARIRFRHVPGPEPQWLLGNLASLKHSSKAQTEWARKFGPVCKIFVGGRVLFSVSDPELCRKLLMKSHHRPLDDLTQPCGGIRRKYQIESLFWSKGQKFKSLKSAWQVAFNQGSVHNYFPLMQRHADQLCNVISEKAENNEAFNIHENVQKMTLEVVGSTAFGIELGLLSESKGGAYGIQANQLLNHLRVLMKAGTGSSQLTPWTMMNHIFPEVRFLWGELAHRSPLAENEKDNLVAIQGIVQAARTIVKNERIKMNSNLNTTNDLNENGSRKNAKNVIDPGSFMAKIVKTKDVNTGEMLTDDQVGAQAQVFLIAGYDTIANALAFSIYLLCQNPSKKQKLFEELDQFSDDDISFSYQALDNCIYLEAVVKETLRIYPTGAGACVRQTPEAIQLSKYIFPANTNFLVNIYGIHRDPTIWPKPEEFIPERFLEGADEYILDEIHPFAYLPFGGGSRMCPGHRFAMQEAKLALFRILKKFDFELQPGQEKMETKVALTLSPKNGVFVKAYER